MRQLSQKLSIGSGGGTSDDMPEEAGALLVSCCDPGVDHALRLVGETWTQAGLALEQIDHPWSAGDVARLRSVGGTRLLDALDELVTGVSRCRVHR